MYGLGNLFFLFVNFIIYFVFKKGFGGGGSRGFWLCDCIYVYCILNLVNGFFVSFVFLEINK